MSDITPYPWGNEDLQDNRGPRLQMVKVWEYDQMHRLRVQEERGLNWQTGEGVSEDVWDKCGKWLERLLIRVFNTCKFPRARRAWVLEGPKISLFRWCRWTKGNRGVARGGEGTSWGLGCHRQESGFYYNWKRKMLGVCWSQGRSSLHFIWIRDGKTSLPSLFYAPCRLPRMGREGKLPSAEAKCWLQSWTGRLERVLWCALE